MSDEAPEELTANQRAILERLDSMPLNKHKVDLERVQRCHLELDDEPMQFDEQTLASMLQDLADESPFGHEAFVLRAFARALRGEDEHHKLVLRQTKKGRWKSPAERTAKIVQQATWLVAVHTLESEGWQTDAAVHQVAQDNGVSVSTIYAGLSEHAKWKSHMTELSQILEYRKTRTPASDS